MTTETDTDRIESAAIIMTVVTLMNGDHGFRPHEAYLIAAEQFPGREAEVELATLRRALRLQPGQHVCGAENDDDEPCLLRSDHVKWPGVQHAGIGCTWDAS